MAGEEVDMKLRGVAVLETPYGKLFLFEEGMIRLVPSEIAGYRASVNNGEDVVYVWLRGDSAPMYLRETPIEAIDEAMGVDVNDIKLHFECCQAEAN